MFFLSLLGTPLKYCSFCQIHEDALKWLNGVEAKLASDFDPPDAAESLAEIKEIYQRHLQFLGEVKEQHSIIKEASVHFLNYQLLRRIRKERSVVIPF